MVEWGSILLSHFIVRKCDNMILDYFIHKLTEENPPELNADKCINSIGNMECTTCKDICPERAVLFKDKKIVFDGKLCSNCGICRAKCPTHAIRVKGTREENIINYANEKKNLVFSCSLEGGEGNLNISCLNALHPELIASLLIMYKDKKFHFNLSKCEKCKLGYDDSLFRDALNKAVSFTEALGIDASYEIHMEEKDLSNLIVEEISRRDLFKLVRKESENLALKTINTIIDNEESRLSYRKILLINMKNLKSDHKRNCSNIFWEYWDVNTDCNGCGKCESICPGKAWKIENTETKVNLYHNPGNCYKCGLCEKICTKKAISVGGTGNVELSEFNLKREINLNTCKICNRKFILHNQDKDECDICKKKELLRRKISTSLN